MPSDERRFERARRGHRRICIEPQGNVSMSEILGNSEKAAKSIAWIPRLLRSLGVTCTCALGLKRPTHALHFVYPM